MYTARMVIAALAMLVVYGRIATAAEPPAPADNAQPAATFRIPEEALKSAKELASAEASKPVSLKNRRPKGLEDIDNPAALQAAIKKTVSDLADKDKQDTSIEPLRYLGDDAFDALRDGAVSEDPQIAKWCCLTLLYRGKRAVPILCEVLESKAPSGVRSAAASSLGQTFEADGVPSLIAALEGDDRDVRSSAMHSIAYPRDARAIEPLRKLVSLGGSGHVAQQSINHIQKERGYDWWPPEYRDLLQLCRDAHTFKGERYGKVERGELIQGLKVKRGNIVYKCLFALAELEAREAVPAIKEAPLSAMKFHALAKLGTPEAFDYLIEQLQSPDKQQKELVLDGLSQGGGRWAAPLLIALLDDASLKVPASKDPGLPGGLEGFDGNWPEWHRAHSACQQYFVRFGLPGKYINLATGATNNVPEEIVLLKKWWAEHGKDFVKGKTVPNPNLSSVHFSS